MGGIRGGWAIYKSNIMMAKIRMEHKAESPWPIVHRWMANMLLHQGLSGYAFWAVIEYGYTPMLRI